MLNTISVMKDHGLGTEEARGALEIIRGEHSREQHRLIDEVTSAKWHDAPLHYR